jgi:hypothetical protein
MDRQANITIFLFMTTQILNIAVQAVYCSVTLKESSNSEKEQFEE